MGSIILATTNVFASGTPLTNQSFNYSGSVQTIGPGFVGTLTITMRGGHGGTSGGSSPRSGGNGAQVSGTYTLQSSDILQIFVGQDGPNGSSSATTGPVGGVSGPNGANSGGSGGNTTAANANNGTGGAGGGLRERIAGSILAHA